MANRIRLTAPVAITANATGNLFPRAVEMIAYTGGTMRLPGIELPVVVDLETLDLSAAHDLPFLLNHDQQVDCVVGKASSVAVENGSLIARGLLTGHNEASRKVYAHVQAGYTWQASIGADPERMVQVQAGQIVSVNGQEFTGPLYVAYGTKIREISFVVLGADSNTLAIVASAGNGKGVNMSFEEWLMSLGFDTPDSLTEIQRANLMLKYKEEYPDGSETPSDSAPTDAATPPVDGGGDPVTPIPPAPVAAGVALDIAAYRRQVAAETRRVNDIRRIAAGRTDIETRAIEQGWSAAQTELAVLRAARPTPTVITSGGNGVDQVAVLEAAICQAGRLGNLERHFDSRVLDTAHRQFRSRLSLQELLLTAARGNGYHGAAGVRSNLRPVLTAAMTSTLSLPGIFANTANKFLLQGYSAVDSVWSVIASKRSVSDFKTVTSYRMTGDLKFEQVGPDGELKHGTADEQSFTNKAETYGKMFAITRQDIINDDLGALTAIPQRIGRGAALKLNGVFWTEFLDNASFFASGNNNYFEGAATNLQMSSLKTAVEKFRKQTDPDGDPIGVTPKFLLVPPELETTAEELYQSLTVNTGGSATTAQVANANVHAKKYQPVVTSYLSNSSYSGYLTTGWYLLADPADLSVIEVCFLNGVESPTVESADADFNTLGVQMRGYFDFGVNKQDHRGGVKSKGAA